MQTPDDEFVVDFPTLWVATDWVEAHCVIPDGWHRGEPFELQGWQLVDLVQHYRVKDDAQYGQLATAFHYRRSQIVRPQKAGKGPFTAATVCLEAVGPALFAGWASGGEVYRCRDHGCGCGWSYEYRPGEPMGMPWPTPLIQITAYSEEQASNVFDALRPMIEYGPLTEQIPKTGEEFIRLPNGGRIDRVTSSAQSRLGQRVTFCPQDETGIWTATNKMINVAETQRRGLAGMGGRSCEYTNGWDPSENSVAQRTAESRRQDIFRDHPLAPSHLSYRNKQERRRIHRIVYAGSPWVDLDAIEAEAAELLEHDPAQAERFFGNRIVAGHDSFLDPAKWDARAEPREVPDGTKVVLGFDGSEVNDWTAIRAETLTGYQFTPVYGPDALPTIWNPADYGGQVPRLEVDAALEELMDRYDVVRMYVDPPDWETELDGWQDRYGKRRVMHWWTRRPQPMFDASERFLIDVAKPDGSLTHDDCPTTAQHVANARKAARPGGKYVLGKPSDAQKIDCCVTSIICHEAAGDAIADGLNKAKRKSYAYTSGMRWG